MNDHMVLVVIGSEDVVMLLVYTLHAVACVSGQNSPHTRDP